MTFIFVSFFIFQNISFAFSPQIEISYDVEISVCFLGIGSEIDIQTVENKLTDLYCFDRWVLKSENVFVRRVSTPATKTSTNASKHSFKYAKRVRTRALQDPVSHNFPYSFDDAILETQPLLKNNGYKIFQKAGTMNSKNGVFEIGLTKNGVIDHRFFRPY